MTRGRHKTGHMTNCPSCGTEFYRAGHNIRNNTKKYCSIKCSAIGRQGEGNHFFGKKHPPDIIEKIKATKKIRGPQKSYGPPKGGFSHTPEAKAKMSAALRRRWQNNRVKMLSYCRLGKNAPYKEIQGEPRHRFIFTIQQKKDWIDDKCFYCKTTEDLVLDHIIPIICSGTNIRENAQTLCGDCNRWKMRYVDRPLYAAILGYEQDSNTES